MNNLKTFEQFINENGPFNDAGEPMMTHNQYRLDSEPSQPDFDDRDDGPEMDEMKYLSKELLRHDILLEGFGDEYIIRCEEEADFMIWEDKGIIIISTYNKPTDINTLEEFDDVHEAIKYILSKKDEFKFKSVSQVNKERDHESDIMAADRRTNQMERGGY